MRHAIIDIGTNKVVNVIEWDGKTPWMVPEGHYLIQNDNCQIDDIYKPNTKSFSAPETKL